MPARRAPWTFEWLHGLPELPAELATRWDLAFEEHGNIWQSRQLVACWEEHVVPFRGLAPRLLIATDALGRELVYPLYLQQRRVYGVGFPTLEPMGGALQCDYQDPLVTRLGPPMTAADWGAFWSDLATAITAEFGKASELMVYRLRNSTPVAYGVAARPASVAPMIRLAGRRDLDALLVHRGVNLRQRVSRLLRRLEERGCTSPSHVRCSDLPDALEQFFTCYARQWGRDGRPHALQSPETRPYWTALAHAAAAMNKLHFSSLRVAGRDWHWHLGFHHNGTLLWYKMTYDQEFADKSPGMLHLALLIREGLEQGTDIIDLGYGSEEYKYKWTDDQVELHSIYLPGTALVNVARNLTRLGRSYASTLKRRIGQRVAASPRS